MEVLSKTTQWDGSLPSDGQEIKVVGSQEMAVCVELALFWQCY